MGSLVIIIPRAFKALVRIKTGGASKACNTTFRMGLKKTLNM